MWRASLHLVGLSCYGNTWATLNFEETHLFSLGTNLCYIVLSYQADIHAYTVLYCVYMFVAYRGWRQWTSARADDSLEPKVAKDDSRVGAK